MITEMHWTEKLSFGELHLDLYPVGEDICAVLSGGEKPHIGCTVLAVPRESLRGDGTLSVTSSVINVTGHKDEVLCREAAEVLCRRFGCRVVCSGGFHVDNMSAEAIEEVTGAMKALLA